jgi:anti-sigma factor RsiW
MSHLGQRLSALIDSELSDFERDRVLAHLAGCDACRGEAIALRALKQRINSLGEAMADTALTGRLMAMAAAAERGPWGSRATWPSSHRYPPARYLAAGIFTFVVVGLGSTAFVIGGDQQPSPRVTPAVDMYMVQHAIINGDLLATPSATVAPANPLPSSASASSAPGGPVPASSVPASSVPASSVPASSGRAHPGPASSAPASPVPAGAVP